MITRSLLLVALLAGSVMAADDTRQLATMPPAAEANIREEMRANLLALNEIISLTVTGKVKEAGELAEKELGLTAMGKNRALPLEARPGANMPPAMPMLGIADHKAGSAFAAETEVDPAFAQVGVPTRYSKPGTAPKPPAVPAS